MTGDNLELVRELREAFGADPGTAAPAERLIEVIERVAAPELEAVLVGGAITTNYTGIEGLRAGWTDFLRAFDSVRIEFEEMIEIGDTVVDMVTLIGVPKGTELEIEEAAAALFEFDQGRLVRVEYHLDRDEALRRARQR